jgi:hypothetical protein
MARSSTRLIRNRQNADAAQLREMKAKAQALASPANRAAFRRGFDRICADVRGGLSAGSAYDLASSVRVEPDAYMRGANAALDMIDGDGSYAKKLAQAYGVNLDE